MLISRHAFLGMLVASLLMIALAATTVAAPPAQTDDEVTVLGTTTAAVEASYLDGSGDCEIEAEATVLAVADGRAGLLVFSSGEGCEGLVAIDPATTAIDWEDADALAELPTSTARITAPRELGEPDDYDDVCENAAAGGRYPEGGGPYTVYAPRAIDNMPEGTTPTTATGVDLVVCTTPGSAVVETCTYIGGGQYYYIDRVRYNVKVQLVNYQSGLIVAQQTFYGEWPPTCPRTIYSTSNITGDRPASDAWFDWVRTRTSGQQRPPVARTTVNTDTLNCRPEPTTDSEVLTQITRGTPVNLIARNEEADWVVALLPDMTKAWLYTPLLEIADRTSVNTLPVVEGEAAEVAITLP